METKENEGSEFLITFTIIEIVVSSQLWDESGKPRLPNVQGREEKMLSLQSVFYNQFFI